MKLRCINYTVTESLWMKRVSGGLQSGLQLKTASATRPDQADHSSTWLMNTVLFLRIINHTMLYFCKRSQLTGVKAV